MLKYGYVPDDFGADIIIHLIKNIDDNAYNLDNYCSITLSPVASKVLEMVLVVKLNPLAAVGR